MKFFVKLGLDSIRPTPARPFGLLIVGAAAMAMSACGGPDASRAGNAGPPGIVIVPDSGSTAAPRPGPPQMASKARNRDLGEGKTPAANDRAPRDR